MGFFDFGRKFVNSLPGVGGLTSALWGDPSQEAVQQSFQQARDDMAKQRANMMGARMNAMNQGALAFGPRNQMLGQMMGQQGPLMDLGPMLQNPMPDNMQTDIRQAAFGNNMAPFGLPPQQAGGAPPQAPGQPYRRY